MAVVTQVRILVTAMLQYALSRSWVKFFVIGTVANYIFLSQKGFENFSMYKTPAFDLFYRLLILIIYSLPLCITYRRYNYLININ